MITLFVLTKAVDSFIIIEFKRKTCSISIPYLDLISFSYNFFTTISCIYIFFLNIFFTYSIYRYCIKFLASGFALFKKEVAFFIIVGIRSSIFLNDYLKFWKLYDNFLVTFFKGPVRIWLKIYDTGLIIDIFFINTVIFGIDNSYAPVADWDDALDTLRKLKGQKIFFSFYISYF